MSSSTCSSSAIADGLWKDQNAAHSAGTHVAAQLEGWLLRSTDRFPYLFLVALEAGSLLRAIALLLVYPIAWLLDNWAGSHHAALKLLVFIACAGLPLKEIEAVGRAVLPRFFAEDVRARAWKAFAAFPTSHRQLVSQLPRPFVDSFARKQLGAENVVAPDLYVTSSGVCHGFLKESPRRLLASTSHLGTLASTTPSPKFLGDHLELLHVACKEGDDEAVSMCDLQSPVIFHDGRLVQRPTPLMALLVLVWMPVGFILALARLLICGRAVPFWAWWPTATRIFGMRVVVKGKIPAAGKGVLIVSNHRTLVDPVMMSVAIARPLTAVTYSLSRVSEMLSPIRTVRLERDPEKDLKKLRGLVQSGQDVVVCPEGTTSREPLLLRFSALFAEVTDDIVPVAVRTKATLFHGTTVRGFKAMDPFFFLMNPVPSYEITFLNKLSPSMTCKTGLMSRYDVANHVQSLIASSLGFKCTSFTRRDKYGFLAGTDGSINGAAPMASSSKGVTN